MDPYIFWKVTISDLVQFASFIATIYIAFVVNKNFQRRRYIKEYLMTELKYIRDDYRSLFEEIYSSMLDAKNIKDRLKILSIRINIFNSCVQKNIKLKEQKLSAAHSEFQMFITGDDEFNTHYKEPKLNFSDTCKTKIMSHQKNIIETISQYIVDIYSS